MAGFKTHITTSSVVGIAVGVAGYFLEIPLDSACLGAVLCSVAGMLPDLDSNSGVPLRETTSFISAAIPLLMSNRLRNLGLTPESTVLAGVILYLLIRFGAAAFMKKYTVHRGMFHSLPAAACFSLAGYILCAGNHAPAQLFKAASIGIGYLVHLLLDELYSIECKRGRVRLKKSFGTATKVWGNSLWGNFSTYCKLFILGGLAFGDTIITNCLEEQIQHAQDHGQKVHSIATDFIELEK